MCSWRRDQNKLSVSRWLLVAAFAVSFAVRPASANTLAIWVQLGPNNEQHREPNVVARAITDDAECPVLRADGQPHPMKLRATPETALRGVALAHFPVRSCEANVPSHVVGLTFDSAPLPLMRGQPRRIVIIGDTGCRIEHTNGEYYRPQDCNDADAWPYAKIARHAAEARVDLVIHVGDYHYREAACPEGWIGCKGTPYGPGWDVWNADFFEPSAPLFAAAPWIMVRGNRETCERAGEGWFRFLDANAMPKECSDFTEPTAMTLGDFTFVVMDTASADPKERAVKKLKQDGLNELLVSQFQTARRLLAPDVDGWLLTHRPLYGLRSYKGAAPNHTGTYVFDNTTLQAAAVQPADLLSRFEMIVSGHIHSFEALNVEAVVGGQTLHRTPQLVVGIGGDNLEPLETGCNVEGGKGALKAKAW
jgi:predicted phosphodiesterase